MTVSFAAFFKFMPFDFLKFALFSTWHLLPLILNHLILIIAKQINK